MPELPEVEVSRQGLLPYLPGQRIVDAIFRTQKLRHDIPDGLASRLTGLRVDGIHRRGKYLLFDCESKLDGGWLILHLGMSGSLRLVTPVMPAEKHDHVDLVFADTVLRFRDPRRFGVLIWHEGHHVDRHPLIAVLGVEPLIGRALLPSEGIKPGLDAVVVLGYDYWTSELGQDRTVAEGGAAKALTPPASHASRRSPAHARARSSPVRVWPARLRFRTP